MAHPVENLAVVASLLDEEAFFLNLIFVPHFQQLFRI
jgi:hypothetical protein